MRVSHDWFWFYSWVDEKLARVFLSQSCGVANAKPITFRHSQMKTALCALACVLSQRHSPNAKTMSLVPGGGERAVLGSLSRLMVMCRWTGSHFHDRIDHHGVAFSIEFLRWGRMHIFWFLRWDSSYSRLANVPGCLYCRWKVKWSSFNIRYIH